MLVENSLSATETSDVSLIVIPIFRLIVLEKGQLWNLEVTVETAVPVVAFPSSSANNIPRPTIL